MTIATERFGSLEIADDSVIRFPDGIPGFEHLHRFVCVARPSSAPVIFLQAVDDGSICFSALPVALLGCGYKVSLGPEDREQLAMQEDVAAQVCLTILSRDSEERVTANLLSPLVINVARRLGRQVIQSGSSYSLAQPLDLEGLNGTTC